MIVGIDLGTTNSLVAVWREGATQLVSNALGELLTPSVVGLDDEGHVLVGKAARERLQTHPATTTALFKRHMGSAHEVKLGSRSYRPEELSALVLKSLKADVERAFGEPVTEAVISVPAYFSDAQRKATRVAGELAGLKVDKLINEPTAAALAYGLHQKEGETSFLVFDLGGGTFDVSILELFDGVMEVRASAGDNFLGGEDFDNLLLEHFVSLHKSEADFPATQTVKQTLRREAERVRKALGQDASAEFVLRHADREWRKPITQDQLIELYAPLLDRLRAPIERALRDARIRVADLDEILLVGGTTRMPLIRKLTASLFGRFPSITLNPDEVVAMGAAIQGGVLGGDVTSMLLLDVTPLTLGIETMGGILTKMIERNTTIPHSKTEVFSTAADNQTAVDVFVFQGERQMARDNKLIGNFRLSDIPPAPRGMPQVEVTFDIDANGILSVKAKDKATGKEQRITIEASSGLSEDEIKNMVDDAKSHEAEDEARRELIEARNQLDARIYEVEKTLNEHGDKLPADEKANVEAELAKAREAKDNDSADAVKAALESLTASSHKLAQVMYQAQGAPGGAAPGDAGATDGGAGGDDVIDAEYEDA